jgi:hypothetical protein
VEIEFILGRLQVDADIRYFVQNYLHYEGPVIEMYLGAKPGKATSLLRFLRLNIRAGSFFNLWIYLGGFTLQAESEKVTQILLGFGAWCLLRCSVLLSRHFTYQVSNNYFLFFRAGHGTAITYYGES